MTRPTLFATVGLPGSGKTTYSTEVLLARSPNALLLSSDDIRETFGPTYKASAEEYVWGVVENFTRGCLAHGRDVIIDATNVRVDRRRQLLYYAFPFGARTECHYIMCSPLESKKRSAKWIPEADIDSLWDQFTEPQREEGWDKIVHIDGERRKR